MTRRLNVPHSAFVVALLTLTVIILGARMIPKLKFITSIGDPKTVDGGSASSSGHGSSAATAVLGGTLPGRLASSVGTTPPSATQQAARRPHLTAVCISDMHGLFQEPGRLKVPQGDLLLLPGDLEARTPAEVLAFSHWLEGLPVRGPKVLTWGNMDTATQQDTPVPGAIVLVNTIQEVNGYRIFGSPFTPSFAGAYQLDLDPDSSFEYWSKLLPPHSDVDIILTHGPPYGIADKTGGRHRGDRGLLRAVQALHKAPLLWVCGHIHEQYGEHRVPHTAAPGGSFLLINSAVFYVERPGHEESAQPRAVRLPEGQVLPPPG